MYFVYDGCERINCDTMEEAMEVANQAIEYAKENCDPEWPDWVDDVCIMKVVAISKVVRSDEIDGDNYCDYGIEVVA